MKEETFLLGNALKDPERPFGATRLLMEKDDEKELLSWLAIGDAVAAAMAEVFPFLGWGIVLREDGQCTNM